MKKTLFIFSFLCLNVISADSFEDTDSSIEVTIPEHNIQNVVLKTIDYSIKHLKNHSEHKFSEEHIQNHIEEDILPNFDLESMAKAVWKKHWNIIEEKTKNEVLSAFEHKIFKYFKMLSDKYAANNIEIYKTDIFKTLPKAKVFTKIYFNDKDFFELNFVLTKDLKDPNNWKIIDFELENFTFTSFVRSNIDDDLSAKKYDLAIKKMFTVRDKENHEAVLFRTFIQKVLKR